MPKSNAYKDSTWSIVVFGIILYRYTINSDYPSLFKMFTDTKQVLYSLDAKSVAQLIDGYSQEANKDMNLARTKTFLVRNPGALFIMAFEALVFACASLLIQGSTLVEVVSVFAYCFLVIGVVLQAWRFVVEKGARRLV